MSVLQSARYETANIYNSASSGTSQFSALPASLRERLVEEYMEVIGEACTLAYQRRHQGASQDQDQASHKDQGLSRGIERLTVLGWEWQAAVVHPSVDAAAGLMDRYVENMRAQRDDGNNNDNTDNHNSSSDNNNSTSSNSTLATLPDPLHAFLQTQCMRDLSMLLMTREMNGGR